MTLCSWCGGDLGDSPSEFWCSDYCQGRWQAIGTDPLPPREGAMPVGEFQSDFARDEAAIYTSAFRPRAAVVFEISQQLQSYYQ